MSDSITTTTKNGIAAAVASVTTAVQCVLGFTGLGAKLGVERTLVVAAAGLMIVATIVAWVVTIDVPRTQRRIVGTAGIVATLALTLTALWATFTFHNILVRSSRVGNGTTTSFRGAITPSEAHVEFYTRPAVAIRFRGYEGTIAPGTPGVERFSDTTFTLHQLDSNKTIVLRHVSAVPLAYEATTGSGVGFTTVAGIWRKVEIAAGIGGIICGGAASLVWWLSSLARPSQVQTPKIGFRTKG